MKMTLRIGLMSLALSVSGCAMTHPGTTSSGDAGPEPDADHPDDGGPPEPDAGTVTPDASSACEPFVDRAPLHFDAAEGPLSIAAEGDTFHVSYFHGNPNPCDGPCLGELSLGVEGPSMGFQPSYWITSMAGETEVVGGDGLAVSVAYYEGSAAWRYRPLGDEPWRADGTLTADSGTQILSMVPSWDNTLSALTRDAADGENGFGLREMVDLTPEGEVLRRFSLSDATGGFEVQEAHLVPARLGGAWLVSIQNWDFPPTVQVNRINGPGGSFHGSSCGVDDYDAAELGDETVVVAQRCGTLLEVEVRTPAFAPMFLADDAAALAPAVSVLRRNLEVAVVYVREGADAPTLMRLAQNGGGFEVETVELSVDPLMHLPITRVDLAFSSDGTLAVAWLGTQIGEAWDASEGALQRLRACR